MNISLTGKLDADMPLIKQAVETHTPLEFLTYTLPREEEAYITEMLTQFLALCNKPDLAFQIDYCLKELLTNAKKANTKRVYFVEKKLDINDPQDYDVGMISFNTDVFSNVKYYLNLQAQADLYVKLVLLFKGDSIIIEVRNNSLITEQEQARINERLENVTQFKTLEEVMMKVFDPTECAGFGIIVVCLMLQKCGFKKEDLKIYCEGEDTVARIECPL